jgi:TrmH family RNA methyltransferase
LSASNEADRLIVVLVRPRNPLNIGAVARAISNFGFQHLRVVNPYEVAFRQARSAVGAAELLARAQVHESVASAVADCELVVGTTAVRRRDLQHPVHRLNEGAAGLIHDQLRSGRVALLFGSEKTGLSNDELTHCHWLLQIPTHAQNFSMNLGQAVAVCLYEVVRGTVGGEPRDAVSEDAKTASAGEVERVIEVLLKVLHDSGYTQQDTAVLIEEKVRRMFRRMNLRSGDAAAWLGMLRQIIWKLEQAKK